MRSSRLGPTTGFIIMFVVRLFDAVSLLAAESDEVIRKGRSRSEAEAIVAVPATSAAFSVCSLHDDVLSLPCDGVSDTRLCVSSNPSSFSS